MNCSAVTSIYPILAFWNILFHFVPNFPAKDFVEINQPLEWEFSSGDKKEIIVSFQILEGYHIQANQVMDQNLIPTSISTQIPDGIIIGESVFPDPVSFHLKNGKEAMLVFNDELKISMLVSILEKTDPEFYKIKGNLHYQACDSAKCFFPRDLPFVINISVK